MPNKRGNMKNWKTTLTGVVALLITVLTVLQQYLNGVDVNWNNIIPLLIAGILGLVAKDSGNIK